MTEFYSCRHAGGEQFQITKFDENFNVLASYETSTHGCMCKAGHRPTCRHREMLLAFRSNGHVGDGWMIDWHTRLWWQPNSGDIASAVAELTEIAKANPGKCGLELGTELHKRLEPVPAGTLPAPSTIPESAQEVQEGATSPARGPEVEHSASRVAPSGSAFPRRRFV